MEVLKTSLGGLKVQVRGTKFAPAGQQLVENFYYFTTRPKKDYSPKLTFGIFTKKIILPNAGYFGELSNFLS